MTDSRETGFGAPDDGGLDLGFGSPDDGGTLGGDTGFGSPSSLTGARPSQAVVSDDGGEIVSLVGDFSGHSGPYRLYVVTPDGDLPCYGGTPGRGYACWADAAASALAFVTPPAAPGTYDLKLVGVVEETIASGLTYVSRVHYDAVFHFRRLWPAESMFAGVHDIGDEPWSWSHALSEDIREPFVKAVGEELALLAGVRMVRLTSELAPSDTTAEVESTYGLPDAGVVYAEGLDEPRLVYTGKTATTLTGLVRDPYERQTAPRGAVLSEGEASFNALDVCVDELLLARAEGAALDRLATAVVGVVRPGTWMDDDAFRELAMTVAYLDCGTWWAVWRVCEAWLRPFAHEATVTIAGASLTDATAGFSAHHVGRYVRVFEGDASRVHRIVDVSGDTITLDATGGPYWVGANYTSGSRTYRLLAFWIDRDADIGGELPGRIRVWAAVTGLHAPPTYVQALDAADYDAVTPPSLTASGVDLEQAPGAAGDNYRGFVLESPDEDGTALYPDVPVYVYDGDIPELRLLLEDVVPAWCRVEVDTATP